MGRENSASFTMQLPRLEESSVLEGRPHSSMQSPCQCDSLVSFTHFWMVLPFPSSISQNILFPAMELAEDDDGKCVELNASHTSEC